MRRCERGAGSLRDSQPAGLTRKSGHETVLDVSRWLLAVPLRALRSPRRSRAMTKADTEAGRAAA
jgi:hypothetical protein